MKECSRRSAILTVLASSSLLSEGRAATSISEDETRKREFVERVNKFWKQEAEVESARAKEAERRGEFASLAPPQELKPFKDWDYYYTKGRAAVWSPNAGQAYKAVGVPSGFVTDLTSIPQWAWSLGIRPEGPYAYAAIVHDYLYWTQERPRPEADEIFLMAMEDSKVDQSLRTRLYNAVRLGGQKAWDRNAKLKGKGERRFLKQYPPDFTISWSEWKVRPGVFRD